MALQEFWDDVRERIPLLRDGVAPPDAPRLTAADLESALAENQRWWIFGRLKGYEEKDFDFLPSADRQRLTELVERFNDIAPGFEEVAAVGPSDTERVRKLTDPAIPPLRDIALLLGLDRYFSWEALRYGKLVERQLGQLLPDGVVELRFFVGEDSGGDPAIWVWAFLSDEATATHELLVKTGRRVRPILRTAARAAAPNHYPYILFRGISERVEEEVAA